MAKILALDFGEKRCGIAETDELQIIASALDTVPTPSIQEYLDKYIRNNAVECLVVGLPVRMSGELSEVEHKIRAFIEMFVKKHPLIKIERLNEAFTSKMAMDTMIMSGAGKKSRRDKGNLDKISATLILQQYLEIKRNANRYER